MFKYVLFNLFQIGLCSILGLPWFVAATVLSINHVRSLSRESECSAPGERPKFLGVREQRVTGTIVFLLVGVSVSITPILKVLIKLINFSKNIYLYFAFFFLFKVCAYACLIWSFLVYGYFIIERSSSNNYRKFH